ncbi:MAG: META domain-containing protein [Flavobacteriaceae bacterium]
MKTPLFFTIAFFIILSFYACEDTQLLSPPATNQISVDILGHWDIEGGGMLFLEEDRFSVSAGCNSLFGDITIENNSLKVGVIASTLIGCLDEEVANREQELGDLLESKILTFSVAENRAQLFNTERELVMTLIRPENASLVNSWRVNSIRTENAISASILDEDTGITFLANGEVRVQTACNSGQGSFSINANSVRFNILGFTERGCEADRNLREQEFTQALFQINYFSILRNVLQLSKDDEVYITLIQEE